MIIIKTTHGEFAGRTINTIVRRIYGRKANWYPAEDRTSINYGQIIKHNKHGNHVLATIICVTNDNRNWTYGPALSPTEYI